MARYIEMNIQVTDNLQKEILIAQLEAAGVEGFEEERTSLKAFINEDDFKNYKPEKIIEQIGLKYSTSIIEDRNWNAEWESGFEPVIIGNFCAIRASFHDAIPGVKHDIIITPKMSFGTGHHATTHMMVQAIETVEIMNKTVFDFGTGTGILSILAEKCGAKTITAIDNDEWSISNSVENLNANNCHKILLYNDSGISEKCEYDIIFANINRNIILSNLASLKQHLAKTGVVLLSGLLTGDEAIIVEEAQKNGLQLVQKWEMNGWICLLVVNK